jgi:hypothetical protein
VDFLKKGLAEMRKAKGKRKKRIDYFQLLFGYYNGLIVWLGSKERSWANCSWQ